MKRKNQNVAIGTVSGKKSKLGIEPKKLTLEDLEDAEDLHTLTQTISSATSEAHLRAIQNADEVLYLKNGQILRHKEGQQPTLIRKVTQRKAKKGQVSKSPKTSECPRKGLGCLVKVLHIIAEKFNIYVNADDIEKQLESNTALNLSDFQINRLISRSEFENIEHHGLNKKAEQQGLAINLSIDNNYIASTSSIKHSYEAALIADFIRSELINTGKKLTFETVMSNYSKIKTLESSYEKGYKNYLYFISTESPEINQQRVNERVRLGGHGVPLIERYYKSLSYLKDVIKYTHRAYIFDNSGSNSRLILSIYKGESITIESETIPKWVDNYLLKYVL